MSHYEAKAAGHWNGYLTPEAPPMAERSVVLSRHADPAVYQPALDWWARTTQERGRLPSRRELHPSKLGAAALPHVLLVDIIGGADDLRFRLMGTAHVAFNARDLTGLLFSQVYPAGSVILEYIKSLYREMMDARRPIWSLNEFVPPTRNIAVLMGRLMMPLSSDGVHVDLCLAVQKISYKAGAGAFKDNPWHSAPYHGEKEKFLL